MIKTGKLRQKITIQRKTVAQDDMGQEKLIYEDYRTVWATVKPIKSGELNFVGKLKPEVTHRIWIRYREDITADMRIRYRGRILEIAAPPIDLDGAHELLEIQAEEEPDGAQPKLST